ncbi:MAG: hypothetical protein QM728_03155 [Gordonia sp. (in: high G+C Gram-positive bacteria)]|uniref:hypothetical protein n=1 Tax=Gordonia sp. (in: high G+C Gram-positive bacteria) TaxID=84139 RepID=UPI0039E29DA6
MTQPPVPPQEPSVTPQPPIPPAAPAGPAGYGPPAYHPSTDPNAVPFGIDVGFKWAWSKLTSNAAGLILGGLVLLLASSIGAILAAVGAVMILSSGDVDPDGTLHPDFGSGAAITGFVLAVLGVIALLVASAYLSSAYTGGLLDIANGVPTTVGSFLRPRRLGTVFVLLMLQFLATMVGLLFFCVGAIVVGFFLMFSVLAVVDRGVGAVDGMKASVSIVRARLGDSFLLWLVVFALSAVLGIFAFPFVQLLTVYGYRRLANQPIAP